MKNIESKEEVEATGKNKVKVIYKMKNVEFKEEVEVIGEKKVKVIAKFDTGANMTSVDLGTAAKARLGPIVKTSRVTSSHGSTRRPVVRLNVKIRGKVYSTLANVFDRGHSTCKLLIGRNLMRNRFTVKLSEEEGKNEKM